MKKEHSENSEQEKQVVNHSENTESTVENSDTVENQDETETEHTEEADSQTIEESWEEKFLEMQDRFVRLHAEFDNFRKSVLKILLLQMQVYSKI
jgi:molecular chaperone GrpE